MKKFKSGLAVTMAWLVAMQPWLLQASNASGAATAARSAPGAADAAPLGSKLQPRELTGFLDDRTAEFRAQRMAERRAGVAEDGTREPVMRKGEWAQAL